MNRRRGPRGDVSRQGLVDAAARVLDATGVAGLTQRAVAQAAGVTPTVLYTYFSGMAEVRHAVGDQFIGTWPRHLLAGTCSPRARMRAFLTGAIAQCQEQPRRAELVAAQAVIGPNSLALNEAMLSVLHEPPPRGAGLAFDEAVDLSGILTEWFLGHLANQMASAHFDPADATGLEQDLRSTPLTRAGWRLAAQRPEAHALRQVVDRVCTLIPE